MTKAGEYVSKYFDHDGLGRVGRSEQSFSSAAEDTFAITYRYNKAGGIEEEKYPSNTVIKSCYDKGGRPLSVAKVGSSTSFASGATYAPHGGLASLSLGNGIQHVNSYNGRQQPTSMKATKGSATLLELGYTFPGNANNGNVETQSITHRNAASTTVFSATQIYTYDPLNRIKTVNEGAGRLTQTFDYDRWGNRAIIGGYNPYSAPVALTAYDNAKNQWPSGGFDARGNQLTAMGWTHEYDAEDRLVKSTHVNGDVATTRMMEMGVESGSRGRWAA